MKTLSSENLEYDGNMDSFLTFVIFALLLWIQYLNEQMFFFVTVMSEILFMFLFEHISTYIHTDIWARLEENGVREFLFMFISKYTKQTVLP